MKNAIAILLFVIFAQSAMIASAQNASSRYVVFQPDNRTSSLSQEDVNRIWKKLETVVGLSGQVMSREDFNAMLARISLENNGSNLRQDPSLRTKLAAEAGPANMIFTRITSWAGYFNLSIEMIHTSNFINIKRTTLPLSAKISTTEQILDIIPELMKKLGVLRPQAPNMLSAMYLVPPDTPSPKLKLFYDSLQKHLVAEGIKMTNDTTSELQLAAFFDTFDFSSQTLDLPMQKRRIVKNTVNVQGSLFLKKNGETMTITFQKTAEQACPPKQFQSYVESVIDSIAHDSAASVAEKLRGK